MAQLRAGYQSTGECLGGRYFWCDHPIFADEVSRAAIETIVADLLATGEFQSAFGTLGAAGSDAPAI